MSIKLEHLSHAYEQNSASSRYAIEDINLTIEKGEFIGLIGHTGSGKSTLIQHLNGLLKGTEGSYHFDGEDVYAEDYDMKKLRSRVGMSFQYPEHQLFEITVLKDVCFGPINMGLSEEEAIVESKKALEAVGLPEKFYEKSPFELSGGQKRRVAIAGVLAMNPEYFILDEPTAGLDPIGRDRILELIYRLHKERNMTIVLVSHSMEDVAEYADRLLVMNKGHLMFDDKPVEVFRHKKELEAMGLSAPETSYVMEELRQKGFFVNLDAITMEQAVDSIYQAISGDEIQKCSRFSQPESNDGTGEQKQPAKEEEGL